MSTAFDIAIPVMLFAVVAVLFVGIYALFRGGDFGRSYSNKLMRLRVVLQFIAILVLVAAFWWNRHGGALGVRIYTRTGDGGDTGLYAGGRASKGDLRIEALGEIDEANAALGVARTHAGADADLDPLLESLQHRLFDLGADVASPGARGRVTQDQVDALETAIDRLEADLEPLRAFILPGGVPAAAALHLARTVVRRAERALVRVEDADPMAVKYLNRASDLLFVAARHANRQTGDVEWKQGL